MTHYIDHFVTIISHPFVLMLMGLASHFGRKMLAAATHGTGNTPCITDLWKKQPIQTLLSLTGAVAGYILFAHFPDFDDMAYQIQNVVRATAFGIGFMADSVADAIAVKTKRQIES
jgi:hypothetical protein